MRQTAISDLTVVMAFAGLAFGFLYFSTLRRGIALLTAGRGWLRPVAVALGRYAAAAVFLGFAAKMGAVPLLAAFFGFLLARTLALRAERKAA